MTTEKDYKETLSEFLDKFCDIFFLNREDFFGKKTGMVEYKYLFFYSCRKKFPTISSSNIAKFLNKNIYDFYTGTAKVRSLIKIKDKLTLKRLEAIEKIIN